MFDGVGVVETGRKLAGANVGAAGDGELCAAAVTLAELSSLVSVALSHVLAEIDARGVTDTDYGMTTAPWLAREASWPTAVARLHLNVGAKLRAVLPVIDGAVVDGRLTAHHARVITDACNSRVADAIAGLQDELVELAQHCSFERWRAEVRGLVELLDEDGAHDPNADLARNQLSVADTLDGITHLAGQLVGEHALVVKHAIDAKADELFRQYTADAQVSDDLVVPDRTTLRALALAELCRTAGAVDVTTTKPPRPEVTLVVNANDPGQAHDNQGTTLADGTTRTLLCDPDLFALVVDSLGVPLDMGRHVRLATTAQRRALAARDGGCVFPGCTLPPQWCDAHHLDEFNHGGQTNLDRLASLCRRHHGVTHRKDWTMHATPDGWFFWTSPSGRTFLSQRHGRRRTGPPPPRRE
jgi:hypothetical protein